MLTFIPCLHHMYISCYAKYKYYSNNSNNYHICRIQIVSFKSVDNIKCEIMSK